MPIHPDIVEEKIVYIYIGYICKCHSKTTHAGLLQYPLFYNGRHVFLMGLKGIFSIEMPKRVYYIPSSETTLP